MRSFSPFLCLIALSFLACNSSTEKQAATDSAQVAAIADSAKKPVMDSVAIAPLPPILPGAKVYFVTPKNGATVKSPFEVVMGVKGLLVDTAGKIMTGTGHHHLLIDAGDSVTAGQPIPKDEHHLHFGKGQTKTMVTLPAGEHTLTLQFGDGIHRSYGSRLAATIKIKVK